LVPKEEQEIRIKVRYLGLIWKKIGRKEEELEIGDDSSLSGLLGELARIHGENLERLYDAEKEDAIDPTYILTVNGISANQLNGLKTRLEDGDEVALMTLISGG